MIVSRKTLEVIRVFLNPSFSFTTPSDGEISILFYTGNTKGDMATFTNVALEEDKGQTLGVYEPYTIDKTEFSVPRRLTRIVDVYDEIITDGKLLYRISGDITFDGTENWIAQTTYPPTVDNLLRFDLPLNDAKPSNNSQNIVCNLFEYTNNTDKEGIRIHSSSSYVNLYIDKSKLSTPDLTGFKTWLSVNLPKVYYELKQPEIIEDSQQGYKAPSHIQAYQNGDLVQYATSTKQVKLNNTNTIVMDEKCIEIVELKANGENISGTLGSDGKTITLDSNQTSIVYAKCKRDPSTYLNVQLVAVPTPTNVEAIAKDQSVTLSWNYITGVDNYTILRSTSSEGEYTTIASNITSSLYRDTGLTNGTTYYYKVLANKDGESGSLSVISATPQGIPSIPTGLEVENAYKSVKLTWAKANGASTYKIKRSTTSGGDYTLIADNVSNTTYTDTNLINGTNYYYVVSAVNPTGESANSTEITGQPTIVKPNTPINIDALVGDRVVTLTWHDMVNAESYIIKRATTKGGPYTLVADQITTNTYTESNLSNATPYYYIIIAKNSVGESQPSNEIEVIPGVQRPTNVIIQKSRCWYSSFMGFG